jgi:hypothetical protein
MLAGEPTWRTIPRSPGDTSMMDLLSAYNATSARDDGGLTGCKFLGTV